MNKIQNMLSHAEGKIAVETARKTIEEWVRHVRTYKPEKLPAVFQKQCGVFVTIFKNKNLRGCIGYPYPIKPLEKSLIRSAVSVCQDPRFPTLKENELDKITVEVSILTEPTEIKVSKPEDVQKKIKIGKDGLIISRGLNSGLLLPQVPIEQNWSIREYLENLCLKANLRQEQWADSLTQIFKFQTQIFGETEPNREVKEIKAKK